MENGEGLLVDADGLPAGVAPQLLRSVGALQRMARLAGLKIYWGLLDGNSWRRNGDALSKRIFSEAAFARAFAENVLPALAPILKPEQCLAMELLNEPESMSAEVVGAEGLSWEALASGIRFLRDAWRGLQPNIPATAGCQAVFLPGLWSETKKGDSAPVDFVDLHVYHPDGGLPPREDLPVDIGGLPLVAGECGRASDAGPDEDHLLHYFYNAVKLGYEAAFFWKLEGEGMLCARDEERLHHPDFFQISDLGRKTKKLLFQELNEVP